MKELRPLELPKTGISSGSFGLDQLPSDLRGVGVRVIEDGPALHEGVNAQATAQKARMKKAELRIRVRIAGSELEVDELVPRVGTEEEDHHEHASPRRGCRT
jgi:hypothetical protein